MNTLTFVSSISIRPHVSVQTPHHLCRYANVKYHVPHRQLPCSKLPKPTSSSSSPPSPSSSSSSSSSKKNASSEDALLSVITSISSSSSTPHVTPATSAAHEVLTPLIDALENIGGFSRTPPRRFFPATWKLVATDSVAVARNNGSLTGFPGASCTQVTVILDTVKGQNATTLENLSLLWGLWKTINALEGTWQVDDKSVLTVTYAKAKFFKGLFDLRADSKAILSTTYCSEKIRIGRSRKGEFYVFVNQDEK